MSTTRNALLLAVVLAAVASATCAKVPLTAPAGSTIFAQVNPPFVIANGGSSVVTALVTEPAGTLVPDGTEVFFFTSLGRIDERVQTRDGIAHANFVADSRSGSGLDHDLLRRAGAGRARTLGEREPRNRHHDDDRRRPRRRAPGRPPSRSPSAARCRRGSSSARTPSGSPAPAGPRSSRTSSTASAIRCRTSPSCSRSRPPGRSRRRCRAAAIPEYTDSNGQAFDTLVTRALAGGAQKAVTVTATAANGIQGTVTVFID